MKLIVRAMISQILPIIICLIIPLLIITGFNNHLQNFNSVLSWAMFIFGFLLILFGIGFLIYTNKSFFTIGRGTLAPWDPPKKLVINDAYRYVRNPMISSVLIIVLGEAFIFSSIELFILFLFFLILNHLYFVYSEEPGLIKRFGNDYIDYKNNVPRWIPRITPWDK